MLKVVIFGLPCLYIIGGAWAYLTCKQPRWQAIGYTAFIIGVVFLALAFTGPLEKNL